MTATNQGEREARRAAGSAAEEARALGDTARDEAAKLAETAKDVGRGQAEKQFDRTKGVVEDQIGTVEAALDGAADRLERENSPLASYAHDLSSRLSGLSSRIESASVDDLARDGRRLARDNPALFMLGAVAVGFLASRFLKASDQADRDYVFDRDDDFDDGRGPRAYGAYGDDYRDDSYRPSYGGYRDRGDAYGGRAYGGRDRDLYPEGYRSPVAESAGPRDAADPVARAPMDSTSGAASSISSPEASASTPSASADSTSASSDAATGSAADPAARPDTTLPRVNRPVNDLGAGAGDDANAGTAPRNSNEGGN